MKKLLALKIDLTDTLIALLLALIDRLEASRKHTLTAWRTRT